MNYIFYEYTSLKRRKILGFFICLMVLVELTYEASISRFRLRTLIKTAHGNVRDEVILNESQDKKNSSVKNILQNEHLHGGNATHQINSSSSVERSKEPYYARVPKYKNITSGRNFSNYFIGKVATDSTDALIDNGLAAGGITGIVIGAIGCLLMWLTGCGGFYNKWIVLITLIIAIVFVF